LETQLQGISVKTNQEHYKLYQGYLNKWNEIIEKLKTADRSKAAATYSEYSELKRQETFNATVRTSMKCGSQRYSEAMAYQRVKW